MGIIQAICISEVRGVQKHAIPEADLTPEWGIVGDAHGGNWHRQVSLLGLEKIEAFRAKGADVAYGAFGENLVWTGTISAPCPWAACWRWAMPCSR